MPNNPHKHSIFLVREKLKDVQNSISMNRGKIEMLEGKIKLLQTQEKEYQSAISILNQDVIGST